MKETGFRYHAGEWIHNHITVVDKTLDWPVGIHMHSFFEIEIILSGKGTQNLNGITYPIESGMLLFLTPIDFHSIDPQGTLHVINISFDSEMISPEMQLFFMNRRQNLLFRPQDELMSRILSVVGLLEPECKSGDNYSNTMRKNLMGVLLGLIARLSKDDVGGMSVDAMVHGSIRFIFDHFREDITLAQVAQASGYTPNYFSKLFSDLTGRRYIDFLNSLRTNYAKMLLASTKRSVIDISKASGFSSLSNFARVFKQETGQTPLSFRKSNNNNYPQEVL